MALESIKAYTNITFTEKQWEEAGKTYDLLVETKTLDKILEAIPEEEKKKIYDGTFEIINEIYTYNHSLLGILEATSKDYQDMDLNVEALTEKLNNSEGLDLVKNILTNLG